MRLLWALLGLLVAGCTTSRLGSSAVPYPSSGAAELVDHATSLGTDWPLQIAGAASLLGGLGLFIVGRRSGGLMLLGIGLLLTLAPGWLLEVFHRVTWLGAIITGAFLVMAGVWGIIRLWRILKLKKEQYRCGSSG